jgi:hypothetical protein
MQDSRTVYYFYDLDWQPMYPELLDFTATIAAASRQSAVHPHIVIVPPTSGLNDKQSWLLEHVSVQIPLLLSETAQFTVCASRDQANTLRDNVPACVDNTDQMFTTQAPKPVLKAPAEAARIIGTFFSEREQSPPEACVITEPDAAEIDLSGLISARARAGTMIIVIPAEIGQRTDKEVRNLGADYCFEEACANLMMRAALYAAAGTNLFHPGCSHRRLAELLESADVTLI